MKKQLLFFVMLLLSALLKAQDVTYYFCDFSVGMPTDFKLYDLDGGNPKDEMLELGFEDGKAWVVSEYPALAGSASSTSYNYKVDGQYIRSNKWMVTPGVEIKDTHSILSWKCDNFQGDDGLDVLISTTGDAPENFMEEPVYSSESEVGSWVTHTVKLEKYVGQTIHVAFVNKNFNQYIICVDDIFLGVASKFSFKLKKQEFYVDTAAVSAKGTITAGLNYTITGYTVNCLSNAQTYSKTYTDLSIKPSEKHNFEVTGIPVKKGEVLDYAVTINIEGEEHSVAERSTNLAFLPDRKVIGEEATATWAGFAPRGFVGMRDMKDNYPDDFIGISVHCSGEAVDPMQDEIYANGIKPLINLEDLPSGSINRKYVADPYNSFESYYKRAKKDITIAKVALTVEKGNSDNEVKARVSTQFAIDYKDANYKVALALVEDSVTGYPQANAYGECFYENGIMDGYEDLPAVVSGEDMSYQAVARAIFGAFSGLDNSIPKEVTKDAPVVFDYTFNIPATISNLNNVRLIAMLVDPVTGEIKNADQQSLAFASTIQERQTSKQDVKVYQSSANEWKVEITSDSQPISASLYTFDGQLINEYAPVRVEGSKSLIIPSSGLKGVYLLKIAIGKELITKKIVL